MRFLLVGTGVLCIAATADAGPISKFDTKVPTADYVSDRKLEDIERCLLDLPLPGPPVSYRQPDRPGEVTLLWGAGGSTVWRVDLHSTKEGTAVRAWLIEQKLRSCAP